MSKKFSPSDAEAREKLAVYVYEYLCHVGAPEAAKTFLHEMHWQKQITIGSSPGFLHSWWCVFWDLYCAAPERRDGCEHSTEAKAFHDYGFVNSGFHIINGINQTATPSSLGMPPQGPPGNESGPHPGFFPPSSQMRPSGQQPSGSQQPSSSVMAPQPSFLNPRFPGGAGNPRAMMRFSSDHGPFTMNSSGPPVFPDQMVAIRHQQQQGLQCPPGMMNEQQQRMLSSMHPHRMLNPSFGCLRPSGGGGCAPPGIPMTRPWQPGHGPVPMGPILMNNGPSPQAPGPIVMQNSQNMSDSGSDNLYMMKVSSAGGLGPAFMTSEASTSLGDIIMNGDCGLDIKASPGSCHGGGGGLNGGTPGPPGSNPPANNDSASMMAEYGGMNPFLVQDGDQTESAAILEIKKCIAEDSKRFEKMDGSVITTLGGPDGRTEYFSPH